MEGLVGFVSLERLLIKLRIGGSSSFRDFLSWVITKMRKTKI